MMKWTRTLMAGACLAGLGLCLSATTLSAQGRPTNSAPPAVYQTESGRGSITFDLTTLSDFGLSLADPRGQFEGSGELEVSFLLPEDSALRLITLDRVFGTFEGGSLTVDGSAELASRHARLDLEDPTMTADEGTAGSAWSLTAGGVEIFRFYSGALVELDGYNGRMTWTDVDVLLADEAAEALQVPEAAGLRVGSFRVEAAIRPTGEEASVEAGDEHPVSDGGQRMSSGPDVIVGDLNGTQYYGQVGSIKAYSVGTTSCNIGDENLDWISSNNRHPVIAQNLFRWHNGRFEQIGQSWLKHGFFALSQTLCSNDCVPTSGSQLGVNCSDPYTAGLNGDRGLLGPKYQVNASTGVFPYPPNRPPSNGTIGRRLQVEANDILPAQNPGARWFVEGHYVTQDDDAAGNALNNASYREVNPTGGNPNLSFVGATVREQAAINVAGTLAAGLSDIDGVVAAKNDLPDDGRFTCVSYARDLGNGFWAYEYALHNLNSHRSGQRFTVTLPTGATVQNVGFHDVPYHSGETWSNNDWTVTMGANDITWVTQTHAQNTQANALRWGTLYNFRFEADVAPVNGTINLGIFRPGTPDDIDMNARVPMPDPPGEVADLALNDMRVDYNPATPGNDQGPGTLGQAVDITVTVRNNGTVPITSADFTISAQVNNGTVKLIDQIVTDFDQNTGGTQELGPGVTRTLRFSYLAGELDRCGTYTLIASHDPDNLTSSGMGGPIMGDVSTSNDMLEDYPDDQSNPDDQFSPDLLELEFGTMVATIIPASVIIEDASTEKLKFDIDFTGLGPGSDMHDVELRVDLVDLGGAVQYLNIFNVSRDNVPSDRMRTVRLRVDVSGLFPAPGPGSVYRARLRFRDTNSVETCIQTETTNTVTFQ